jgi:hypothetical protein
MAASALLSFPSDARLHDVSHTQSSQHKNFPLHLQRKLAPPLPFSIEPNREILYFTCCARRASLRHAAASVSPAEFAFLHGFDPLGKAYRLSGWQRENRTQTMLRRRFRRQRGPRYDTSG